MLFTILSNQRDEGKELPWQSVPLVSNSRISHQSTRDIRSAYPLPTDGYSSYRLVYLINHQRDRYPNLSSNQSLNSHDP